LKFTVRLIEPGNRRVETGTFDTVPEHEEARKVIELVRDFLRNRPPQFRDKLEILKQGSLELEWLAAPGGVAFASIDEEGVPLSMAVLLSGREWEADAGMITGFRQGVIEPLMGGMSEEEEEQQIFSDERPLVLIGAMGGSPQRVPLLHMLNTALASVYFEALEKAAVD
jgi:hypothetical protein